MQRNHLPGIYTEHGGVPAVDNNLPTWVSCIEPGSSIYFWLSYRQSFPIDNLVNVPCVATSPSWSGTLEENEKVSKSGVVLSPTTTNMDSTGFLFNGAVYMRVPAV